MWARRPDRLLNSLVQGGLKVLLVREVADSTPLSFAAARKSDRILARRLSVIPIATGLTAASPALISARLNRMAAGSWPSRRATRLTADRRSRWRVGAS